MTDLLFDFLNDYGTWGVLLSLFIEGSAFPFIGTFFIVTVGFVMELSWVEIVWIAVFGSFIYAIGSYIPYFIGYKLGDRVVNRMSPKRRTSFEKATAAFSKYGIWSVAISSPLHLGNVVPFVAGISKMRLRLYTLLTMLGIVPSTFLLLGIGQLFPGEPETAMELITKYQSWVLLGFVVITVAFFGWKVGRQRRRRNL